MSHVLQPEEKEGNREQVPTSDRESRELLRCIWRELQKLNIQITTMTDIHVRDSEIGALD